VSVFTVADNEELENCERSNTEGHSRYKNLPPL
jgi:hypothetical protein